MLNILAEGIPRGKSLFQFIHRKMVISVSHELKHVFRPFHCLMSEAQLCTGDGSRRVRDQPVQMSPAALVGVWRWA
jgi:hypothetical protein